MKNRLKVFFILVAIASGTIAGCGTPEDTGEGNDSGQTDVNNPVGGGGSGTAVCGNGLVEKGETCDDKNTTDRDGCSATCQIEDGFTCDYSVPERKSICRGQNIVTVRCGDGYRDAGEACDDNNTEDGDGCSADCQTVEDRYTCPTIGGACTRAPIKCGDGFVEGIEKCDPKKEGQETCKLDCTGFLPSDKCGNNQLDKNEQCDEGKENNTGGYEKCGRDCLWGPRCGDGSRQRYAGETCDDGNREDNDGCSSTCQIEGPPGKYICEPGKKCILNKCGNGQLDDGEVCDDGNRNDGDGCNANCKRVEKGYECTQEAGQKSICTAKKCGDGILVDPEQCDDGNLRSGDGCSSFCELEDGYHCETPGQACKHSRCGDGETQGTEECDPGLATNPGCTDKCKIVVGYKCDNTTIPSTCGLTECGDSVIQGAEQCDDGNKTDGDGCSSTCQIEDGKYCPDGPGQACKDTVCGNGTKDGHELCDDGNVLDGDGCDHNCIPETKFHECSIVTGKCKPVCGDGITIWPEEKCDDGNLQNGDGCSDTCTVETGFYCTGPSDTNPKTLKLPITYRDFKAHDEYPDEKFGPARDFERGWTGDSWTCWFETGLVENRLGADGTPTLSEKGMKCRGFQRRRAVLKPKIPRDKALSSWYEWYHDIAGTNIRIDDYLTLTQDPNKTDKYVFDAGEKGFFPIDGQGWGNYKSTGHNFHFTSVFKTYFRYSGDPNNVPVLEFIGDDDLWVFINGRLAVDLGGQHDAMTGRATLTPKPLDLPGGKSTYYNPLLNLYAGGIYEIAVFHAERQTSKSNYKITLDGFINTGTSVCESVCGDGIVAANEACDDGNKDNDDGCSSTCIVEVGMACDNSSGISVCTVSNCGNGTREYPEQCDDGNTNDNDDCKNDCTLPRCGDGAVDPFEECDPGIDPTCTADCRQSHCGDGIVEANEECDDANNDNTDACVSCKLAFCGDGFKGPGETCDDGVNDGSYGSCYEYCDGKAPHCGDGVIDAADGEVCDNGTLNRDDKYNGCTTLCKPGPHCGDGKFDAGGMEACDDGDEDDENGCTRACTVQPGWTCKNVEGAKSKCTKDPLYG